MTTKLQSYIQLAGQTAAQVTKNPKNWVSFLNTASRLYRYPFPDQLMIHSQRPKATACTPFLWQYKKEYQDIVTKALEERFGIPGSYGLVDQSQRIVGKLAQDYWENHHKDIVYECEGSRLEELDELSIGAKFHFATAISILYIRCYQLYRSQMKLLQKLSRKMPQRSLPLMKQWNLKTVSRIRLKLSQSARNHSL